MVIHKNGVPHTVRFDWRGAFFWMLQLAIIFVIVGAVK